MATLASTSTKTITAEESTEQQRLPVLRLNSPKSEKKIKWKEGTIDNEGMGKKSSKCCCVYKKPRMFGESSDEDSDVSGDEECKGPKSYHKKSKNKEPENHENCNLCE